ncbi:MAG: hypothetical protein WA840_05390 [Caulobacteraceae bacterium]
MIAGHFGLAAAVKSRESQTPLWALMLATVWLDVVFVPLLLSGIETVQPADKGHTGYGAYIIHADYTHSLVGMIVLSVVLGGLASLLWGRRPGIVVGLVAASHWVLDLLVHRPDMPILPGNIGGLPRLGLGLWRFPLAASGIELALVLAGAWLYWRAAKKVAKAEGRGMGAAAITAALIAVFGILILGMDFTAA